VSGPDVSPLESLTAEERAWIVEDDFSALNPGERALFEALSRHGVRFMLVGLIASKRAAGRTKDIAALPALEEALAAIQAKDA
jgi:hypothetical protein